MRVRVTTVLAAVAAMWLTSGVLLAAETSGPSAGEALARLKAGNERFASDPTIALPIDPGRRASLVAGQAPFAIVLSCADSRVPPEVVFNTGLGDLFVVRAAGQVLDRSVLATIEYGAEHLKAPLLVVMGHEFCGAVKAASDSLATPRASHGPNLDFLIKSIQPAAARSAKSLFQEPLRAAVLANVEQIVGDLQMQSSIIRNQVSAGTLRIVGAFYELHSGTVVFSHPVGGPPSRTSAPTPHATPHAAAPHGKTP